MSQLSDNEEIYVANSTTHSESQLLISLLAGSRWSYLTTQSNEWSRGILVLVDHDSKFAYALAIKDKRSCTIVASVMQ